MRLCREQAWQAPFAVRCASAHLRRGASKRLTPPRLTFAGTARAPSRRCRTSSAWSKSRSLSCSTRSTRARSPTPAPSRSCKPRSPRVLKTRPKSTATTAAVAAVDAGASTSRYSQPPNEGFCEGRSPSSSSDVPDLVGGTGEGRSAKRARHASTTSLAFNESPVMGGNLAISPHSTSTGGAPGSAQIPQLALPMVARRTRGRARQGPTVAQPSSSCTRRRRTLRRGVNKVSRPRRPSRCSPTRRSRRRSTVAPS